MKLRRKVRETWLTLLNKPHPYPGWSLDMEKEVDYRFFVGTNPPLVAPDESTVTLEVRALTRAGELSTALDVLADAADNGIRPRLRTFSPVLNALLREHDLPRASALRAEMARIGLELGEVELVAFVAATAHQPAPDDAALAALLRERLQYERERSARVHGASYSLPGQRQRMAPAK